MKNQINPTGLIMVILLVFSGMNSLMGHHIHEQDNNNHEFPTYYITTEIVPCQIFTTDDIKTVFELKDTNISAKAYSLSYPQCSYSWEGNNKKKMNIGGRDMEINVDSKVSITIVPDKMTKETYETSIKVYKGKTVDCDFGDAAVWSDDMNQLTVLIGEQLFHIMVDYIPDNQKNKQKAEKIFKILAEKLC